MREEAEASLDEIFSDAGVAEDDELRDRAQRVVDMLPEYIDQEDIDGFVSFIREETSAYGNERALIAGVLDLLLAQGDVTPEFVKSINAFFEQELAVAAKEASDEDEEELEDEDDEDDDEEDEEEEKAIAGEVPALDLGAEAA
ncbi:hypothetical protein EPO33_04525 [Patescibacteria group bacterium]|nr:MAG: hypothetical protein EPO33_04525 [Patescibacteria group bacterium]